MTDKDEYFMPGRNLEEPDVLDIACKIVAMHDNLDPSQVKDWTLGKLELRLNVLMASHKAILEISDDR